MAPFVLGNGNTAVPGLWPHSRCCEAVPAAVENPGGVLEEGGLGRDLSRASSVSGFSASSHFPCYVWGCHLQLSLYPALGMAWFLQQGQLT